MKVKKPRILSQKENMSITVTVHKVDEEAPQEAG